MTMTDQEIQAAFDRLDGALAPPMDGTRRIGERIAVRRRRRRVAFAGTAALAVIATAGTVVVLASGDDGGGDTIAVDQPSGPVSTLVMTRPDGSTYAFDDVTVSCEAPDGADSAQGPQRIWAISPREFKGDRVLEPFVYFEGIVAKIAGDQTFTFPNDWTTASDEYPLVLFMADTEGNAHRSNEVASSAGGESGTVRVVEASCAPVPTLRLEVDMTLGSEVGQQPLEIAGSLR